MRKKLRSARRASPNGTPQPLPRKVGVGSPLSRICTLASPGVVTVVAEAKSKCQERGGTASAAAPAKRPCRAVSGQMAKWKQPT
jgi:hypothetical protein